MTKIYQKQLVKSGKVSFIATLSSLSLCARNALHFESDDGQNYLLIGLNVGDTPCQ